MILAPALVWSLDALWTNGLQNLSYAVPEPLAIILAGGGWAARSVVRDEVRLTLASGVAGIATALLLHRVDRAFAERP